MSENTHCCGSGFEFNRNPSGCFSAGPHGVAYSPPGAVLWNMPVERVLRDQGLEPWNGAPLPGPFMHRKTRLGG